MDTYFPPASVPVSGHLWHHWACRSSMSPQSPRPFLKCSAHCLLKIVDSLLEDSSLLQSFAGVLPRKSHFTHTYSKITLTHFGDTRRASYLHFQALAAAWQWGLCWELRRGSWSRCCKDYWLYLCYKDFHNSCADCRDFHKGSCVC